MIKQLYSSFAVCKCLLWADILPRCSCFCVTLPPTHISPQHFSRALPSSSPSPSYVTPEHSSILLIPALVIWKVINTLISRWLQGEPTLYKWLSTGRKRHFPGSLSLRGSKAVFGENVLPFPSDIIMAVIALVCLAFFGLLVWQSYLPCAR